MSGHSPAPWSHNASTGLIYDAKGEIIGSMIPCDPKTPPQAIDANRLVVSAAPQLLAALANVEWRGETWDAGLEVMNEGCPYCHALKDHGVHKDDCLVMQALQAAKGGAT